jgi:cell division protein FtsB
MLQRLKKNYFLLVSTFLILYFFFNLLSGQRGLISYFEKNQILNNLQNEEFLLTNQIKDLDFKNSLLSDNLDLDYIEALIRERFLFGKKNETIYIIKNDDKKK